MKTLLLVGGVLLLLLGLLLLIAAVVAYFIARSRSAKTAGAPGPAPQPHRPQPQAVAPLPRAATAVPAAPTLPPPMAAAPVAAAPMNAAPLATPAPQQGAGATMVVARPGWGALHVISGKVAGQTFPIPADGFYIGRDRVLAQVLIDDPSVSKKHVWVGFREGVVTAIDQSSTNGTYLNAIGTRIGQVRLSPGDTIIISDDVARFVYKI